MWTGLSRTILNLSFQFLQKASWTSGIKLQADAEQVAFNLTDEEIEWARTVQTFETLSVPNLLQIVNEIDKQLQKEYGNSDSTPKSADDDLSALLNKLGASDKDEKDREIIGLTDDGTLVLPDEPPKQKPLAKVSSYVLCIILLMLVLRRKRSRKEQNAEQVQWSRVIIARQRHEFNHVNVRMPANKSCLYFIEVGCISN